MQVLLRQEGAFKREPEAIVLKVSETMDLTLGAFFSPSRQMASYVHPTRA